MSNKPLSWIVLGASCALLTACTSILGDEFDTSASAPGGAGSGASTTSGGKTGTGGLGSGGSGSCAAGFFDCNQNPDDGCEINIAQDVDHCGACNRPCGMAGATATSCNAGTCAPTCQSGFGDCTVVAAPIADDGCEVALGVPKNCSACGHDCNKGSCTNSQCEPYVLSGTAAGGSVHSIVIDATNIYWADRQFGKIAKAPLSGGSPVDLATSTFPVHVKVDATHAYWHEDGGSLLRRAPIAVGAAENINGSSTDAIGVSAAFLYWQDGSNLMRGPKQFNPTGTRVGGAASVLDIEVRGKDVFWTTGSLVRHYNETTTTTTLLYSLSGTTLGALTVDAANLYFIDSGGTLFQAPRIAATAIKLATGVLRDVASDGQFVYYTDGGDLMRVPVGGATPLSLTSSVSRPFAVAVDASGIYFSSLDNGSIYKISHPVK